MADDEGGAGRPVTLAAVKALLEAEQEEREDLSYEQKLALDHGITFGRLVDSQAAELLGKLQELGGKVTEWHAHKIVDVMPNHADDVRAIFQKDRITPEDEEIQKIIDLVKGYE